MPVLELRHGGASRDLKSPNTKNIPLHQFNIANLSVLLATMSTITEVASQEQFDSHIASLPESTLLVLSFYAPWAAPCAQMNTILATLASSYPVTTPLKTSWLQINAEELSDISEVYDVSAVTFLVLIRNGAVLQTISGSDATKVRTAIEEHAKAETTGESRTRADNESIGPMLSVQRKDVEPTVPAKDLSGYKPQNGDAKTVPEHSAGEMATSEEDLHKRLSELVVAAPVMLFMKGTPSAPQCGFSRQLVALLRENGVKYGFFNILADDEVRQGLKEFADWPTFPQLWISGELVGGLDIVSFSFLIHLSRTGN